MLLLILMVKHCVKISHLNLRTVYSTLRKHCNSERRLINIFYKLTRNGIYECSIKLSLKRLSDAKIAVGFSKISKSIEIKGAE